METNTKLRKALTKILNLTNSLDEDCAVDPVEIRDIAKDALAEPVKNYEVGTAEEQCRRFRKYCGCRCLTKCKVYEKGIALGIVNYNNYYKADCRFIWAQMPYTEGGANGN